MKKALFIDRDGTIIIEPKNEVVDSFVELRFLPGVISSLAKIARETDYELVMVTNQDGLGTDLLPESDFFPPHNKVIEILHDEGVDFAEVFIDRTLPEENAPTRKPGTAMLTKYLARGIDLISSFVIGDRITDLELAQNLGCKAVYISDKPHQLAVFNSKSWPEIAGFLISRPRIEAASRNTSETSVSVKINLDGCGKSSISTGIGFFDHMLDQIARHASFDLSVEADGDLNVDAHHIIEDVGIVLGESISNALGNKKGIERYGFMLPMDDSLAQVAVDFSGRPWLVWDAEFKNSRIGDMPSEMISHFFKSFSDNAKCNLNIKASGDNDHHKAEAIFKAVGRSLGMAARKTGFQGLPSTKEKL